MCSLSSKLCIVGPCQVLGLTHSGSNTCGPDAGGSNSGSQPGGNDARQGGTSGSHQQGSDGSQPSHQQGQERSDTSGHRQQAANGGVDGSASEAEEPFGPQQAAGRDHGGMAAGTGGDTTASGPGKGHSACDHQASGDHGIRQASASEGASASTSGQTCAAIAEAPSSAPEGAHVPVPDDGEGKAAADAGRAAGKADEDGRNAGRQAPAVGAAGSADEAGHSAGNQEAGGEKHAPSAGTAEAAGSADEGTSEIGKQGAAEVRQAPAAGIEEPADSADEGSSASAQGDVRGQHTAPDVSKAETSTQETGKPSSAAGDAAKGAAQAEGAPTTANRGSDADAKPGLLAVKAQAEVAEAQLPTVVGEGSAFAKTGPLAGTIQEAIAEAQSPAALPEGAVPDTPVAVEGALQQGAPEEAQVELKPGGARLIALLSCLWPHKVPECRVRVCLVAALACLCSQYMLFQCWTPFWSCIDSSSSRSSEVVLQGCSPLLWWQRQWA